MEKPTKRKAFNFLRSYFDVVNELQNDTDKFNFLMAVINKQFLDEDPNELSFIVKLCYASQKHAIEASVKGWKRVSHTDLIGNPETDVKTNTTTNPMTNPMTNPVQVEVKEKVKVKEKILLSEIKISEVPTDLQMYYRIAKDFQNLFIKNLTQRNAPIKNQQNATFKNYVDPIRLAIINNECNINDFRDVWKYLDSPQGDFWKTNILSTSKLREQIQKLIMSARENKTQSKKIDKL